MGVVVMVMEVLGDVGRGLILRADPEYVDAEVGPRLEERFLLFEVFYLEFQLAVEA